ncbi:flagellar hook capping FlgD N-terminal domain-containing protein [Sphingobium sp. H39-3-25]|uniref:flagellar hook assembly protein FlgD n=1 Tax=Sphingobium arseniciresistens TaxID=3030834 RepID=UPI0023BA39DC|nr:flagellar hook capping FlgD N-terminal domain-containing protein [Sphingobium arseniciresistens]
MTTITGNSASRNTATTTSSTGLSADYNMFLKLLTTQMQNQDPLDPMDTSEYTQQLVQYSQVEQAMQQTGALQDILTQLGSQQMSQASNYIGKEARFDSPVSGLGEAPATWTYYADGTPTTMKAQIKDANGKIVSETTLDAASQGRYSWDGKKSDGTRAVDGAYTLSVTATNASGANLPVTINSVATVKDVVTDGSGVMLGVNGIRMPVSGLVAISSPN